VTDDPKPKTPYEVFGGAPFFEALVRAFYVRVAEDLVLRPLYPEDDLGPAERRLNLFLQQYWGGPGTYSEERGHPALRMRHMPFAIDSTARDHWIACMREAVAEQDMDPDAESALWQYLLGAAFAMQNIPDEMPGVRGIDLTEV
jgi:hemoglobin